MALCYLYTRFTMFLLKHELTAGAPTRFLLALSLLILSPCTRAEISLQDLMVTYGECGVVTINGEASEDGQPIYQIRWDWRDEVGINKRFPASHQYAQNGEYQVYMELQGDSGLTHQQWVPVEIVNANDSGCEQSAVHMSFTPPGYSQCGGASINGAVWSDEGSVTDMHWEWGDGSAYSHWFAVLHEYDANGVYDIEVTASNEFADTRTEFLTVVVENAEVEGCDTTFQVHPWKVFLRDGVTSEQLRVKIQDGEGRLLNPTSLDLRFEVEHDEIGDLQVSESGLVTSSGYGTGIIRAILDPWDRVVRIPVRAGHLRAQPMFQYLSVNGQSTGRVWAEKGYADGSTTELDGSFVAFECFGCEPGGVLQINAEGDLQVIRDFQDGDSIPAGVLMRVNGVEADNAAVIHVSEDDLGLEVQSYVTQNTELVSARQVPGADFDAILTDNSAPEILEQVYIAQALLTGGPLWEGRKQTMIHYVSRNRFGGALPGCGGSGLPIRIGTNMDLPNESCFLAYAPPPSLDRIPNWGILFHEFGHNASWMAQGKFEQFTSANYQFGYPPGYGFAYSEGLATAASMFACEVIIRNGVSPEIAASLENSWLCWRTSHVGSFLKNYMLEGADYSTITPDLVDDFIWTLIQEHGFGVLYRFFSVMNPKVGKRYPFEFETLEKQATFFALAFSEAANQDLKSQFRDDWGFPIDEAFWTDLQPVVSKMAASRDPASYAGNDKSGDVNEIIVLDEAFVFDPEGDELTTLWEVIDKPHGAVATLGDASVLHTTFSADRRGVYMLGLSAADEWVEGNQCTIQIIVDDPGLIFDNGFE
jgi:PKD repeat protein